MKSIHLCCTAVLSILLFHQNYSQGESAVPFLLIHPLPEANGRGNTAVATLSDNPIATLANPAQLGIFSLSNFFSGSIYSPKTEWLPSFGVSDLTYSVWAIQGGYDLSKELSLPFPISVGAGYSRIELNLGTFMRTDSSGREIGRFNAFENSTNFSIAVGAYYFVKVGLGWNFKNIRSAPSGRGNTIEANPSASDFGIILQAPLFDILTKAGSEEVCIFPNTHPLLDFTFGYAKSNMGGNVNYPLGEPPDPLPRNASIGMSAEIGIVTRAEGKQWKIVSVTLAREAADVLIARKTDGSFEYQSGLGDISFFENIILGKVRSRENVMKGWQLNFGEVAYIRGGSFAEGVNFGNRNYSTSGFGVRLNGIFKLIGAVSDALIESSALKFIADHVDVAFDHAEYETTGPLGFTKFNALSLVVR